MWLDFDQVDFDSIPCLNTFQIFNVIKNCKFFALTNKVKTD